MPQAITPLVRPSAPAIASNDAPPLAIPDAVQLHCTAVNALAEALHTLRHADLSPEALSRAIGRARRAATNLKRLAALTTGGAA